MRRQQLIALFLTNLVPYTIGQALLGLLPVYAVQLGMDEIGAGLYLSVAFGALAAATLSSGWLSNRFQQRKRMIILAGAVSIPATFLMGQVSSIALLTVLTMILWFAFGVMLTMLNILTGMYADPTSRGRIFGIMGTTIGLGAILGGFASGAIVDRWGFPALLTLAALGWLAQVLAALFLEDRKPVDSQNVLPEPAAAAPLGRTIWLLIAAHALALIGQFSSNLGRPLMMDAAGFDASAIASTFVVSGFVGLPLPFIIGWLSDRLGRNQLLMLAYLAMSLGVFVLIPAAHLWQFWLSMIFLSANIAGLSVGLAYVNDLAAPAALATATARFSASPWIAGVIGFGATGFVMQALGLQMTFFLAALFPLVSVLLVFAISRQSRPVQSGYSLLRP
jgi:MFS family permease